ncbi:hypothetical protein Sste5346_008376 [Sporothrix stenoceras]|uniref:Alpha/beta hydrolase n=1 Tax=Sporothrix stenoceras TaxID=5173 RepID=A0ABR3YQ39_9PEZI
MADAQSTTFALPGGHSLRYKMTFPYAPESGRPTILLSGLLATTAAVWDDVVDVLHQNGFRTLRYGYETCIAALLSPQFDLRPVEVAGTVVSSDVERVLVVVGGKDADLPTSMKALADTMRDASGKDVGFHVLPNAGHASFIDGFDVWLEVVLPFLQAD